MSLLFIILLNKFINAQQKYDSVSASHKSSDFLGLTWTPCPLPHATQFYAWIYWNRKDDTLFAGIKASLLMAAADEMFVCDSMAICKGNRQSGMCYRVLRNWVCYRSEACYRPVIAGEGRLAQGYLSYVETLGMYSGPAESVWVIIVSLSDLSKGPLVKQSNAAIEFLRWRLKMVWNSV